MRNIQLYLIASNDFYNGKRHDIIHNYYIYIYILDFYVNRI